MKEAIPELKPKALSTQESSLTRSHSDSPAVAV